jgi:hypothetical protein
MPGPLPTDLEVRARQNKAATRAELGEDDPEVKIPPMPKHYEEKPFKRKGADGIVKSGVETVETPWHPMAVAWWNDIWPSPMAKQWHSSDIHGLYALLYLYDMFFRNPNEKTHGEIRLARMPYGLTPLDRRRLEWTLANTKSAENKANKAAPPPAAPASSSDGADLRLVVS